MYVLLHNAICECIGWHWSTILVLNAYCLRNASHI